MSAAFDHRDPGTPESAWAERAPWASAAPLDLDVDLVVVLAAHPDDETLGAGGLLAACAERGIAAHVVVVTDGVGAVGDDTARIVRRRESLEALHEVAPAAALTFLGVADGGVREARVVVDRAVRSILSSAADDARILLACTWWGDGHRDHRVLGEVALGLSGRVAEVVGFPIWMWHWADPAAVDASPWRALPLSPAQRRAKDRALSRHRSQIEGDPPMLHAGMRAHFARDVEVFVRAPRDEAVGVDTAYFDGLYARHADPWGFESRWYEQRKRAVLLASLPRERYDAALELGCATGVLTRALADRAARVTGVDASDAAIERAREHCVDAPTVRIEQGRLPHDWPAGSFDLIVLSELAYYLDADDRSELIRAMRRTLSAGGTIVACHWRHPIADAAVSGDEVHAELARGLGIPRIARYRDDDFVLDVFTRDGASVAQTGGLA